MTRPAADAVVRVERLRRDDELGGEAVHALQEVDLTVGRNEGVAIMGPSMRRLLAPLALLLAVPALAQAPEPRPITLAEAIALAQRTAPQVVQAEGQTRTSAAGVRSAYGSFLPSVSVSAGATRQLPSAGGRTRIENGQIITLPAAPWSSNLGLGANVEVFDGGRRFFDLRQAQARVTSARANEVVQRYGTTLSVKQQYFNVIAARESEGAARAQLEQATQQHRTSVAKTRAKIATRSDSLRAEIQLLTARQAVLDAANDLELANAVLTRVVGSPTPVTAAALDSLEHPALALDEPALRELAVGGPGVRVSEAGLDAARAGARATWTDYLPSVNASYSRSGSTTGSGVSLTPAEYDYSGSLRLSLAFPLFDQFSREARVVSARAEERNADASLRDARLGALEDVTRWLGEFRSADARIASATATLAAAQEDLRVQQQRYGVGGSTLLDVLTSQTQLDQARRDLIRARYDQRVAKAQLEALVGREL